MATDTIFRRNTSECLGCAGEGGHNYKPYACRRMRVLYAESKDRRHVSAAHYGDSALQLALKLRKLADEKLAQTGYDS